MNKKIKLTLFAVILATAASAASHGDRRIDDISLLNAMNEGKEAFYTQMKTGFTQEWHGKYSDSKGLILEIIDEKASTCMSRKDLESSIVSRISKITETIPKSWSDTEVDPVFANKLLNESYIPFCKDMLDKSIGGLSFSKKYNSGIGRNFSNENYCGNFYRYLNHLDKQDDEVKYSYAAFVSRFSDYNLNKNYKGQKELVVRASSLLHLMDYGMAGFEPLGFAELYNKANYSTAAKIGGKDSDLELFLVSILSGSFKTADDILKDNIPATKEALNLIEKSNDCKF